MFFSFHFLFIPTQLILSEIDSYESMFADLEDNLSQLEVLSADGTADKDSLKPLQQSYKAIRHRCQVSQHHSQTSY